MEFFLIFLFFLGFILLIKGADFFLDGAIAIAKKLKVSDLFIGLTLVSVGTSLPELFISITSNNHQNYDILLGNILGSNITNILLILGIGALINKIVLGHNFVWKEIPLSLIATIVLFVLANDIILNGDIKNSISLSDGLILLIFYFVFIFYLYSEHKLKEDEIKISEKPKSFFESVFLVVSGILLLYLGSEFVVNGTVELASLLGVPQVVIALILISFGTSIPELATTIVALLKNNQEIAVGNVVGSCIANILFILGLSALRGEIFYASARNIDLFMAFVSSFVLFLASLTKKNKLVLDRFDGIVFLIIYCLYLLFLLT
jgi:cation:H+ antiporter